MRLIRFLVCCVLSGLNASVYASSDQMEPFENAKNKWFAGDDRAKNAFPERLQAPPNSISLLAQYLSAPYSGWELPPGLAQTVAVPVTGGELIPGSYMIEFYFLISKWMGSVENADRMRTSVFEYFLVDDKMGTIVDSKLSSCDLSVGPGKSHATKLPSKCAIQSRKEGESFLVFSVPFVIRHTSKYSFGFNLGLYPIRFSTYDGKKNVDFEFYSSSNKELLQKSFYFLWRSDAADVYSDCQLLGFPVQEGDPEMELKELSDRIRAVIGEKIPFSRAFDTYMAKSDESLRQTIDFLREGSFGDSAKVALPLALLEGTLRLKRSVSHAPKTGRPSIEDSIGDLASSGGLTPNQTKVLRAAAGIDQRPELATNFDVTMKLVSYELDRISRKRLAASYSEEQRASAAKELLMYLDLYNPRAAERCRQIMTRKGIDRE